MFLLKMILVTGTLTVIMLASSVTRGADATVSGRNGRIVFLRFLDTGKTRAALFTVNPNGTKVQQVTRPGPGVIDTQPDWSPNGTTIAFERQTPCPAGGTNDGLNNTCDRIYTVSANATKLRTLVPCMFKVDENSAASRPGIDCVGVDEPAWSPDGSKLAFQYNLVDPAYTESEKLDAGIWIINADGTGLHQVTQRTPGTGWDFGPQWSPDGTRLVFFRSDFSTQTDALFTVNADGGNETRVTPWTLNAGDSPDWSPDGNWLLFRAQPNDGSSNVYKAHPDGSSLTDLTKQPSNGFHYLSSSFSPDGTKIVTARTPGTGPGGAADVYVMKANGSKPHEVTKTRLWDSGADWGPLARHTRSSSSCLASGDANPLSACVSQSAPARLPLGDSRRTMLKPRSDQGAP